MNLPTWLQETDSPRDLSAFPDLPARSVSRSSSGTQKRSSGKASSWITKNLLEISQLLQAGLFAEEVALKKGFLQSLNPRIKLLALFCFLFIVNFVHHLSLILAVFLFFLGVAKKSGLSLKSLLQRVSLIVFLFGGLPIFPSLFSWVRSGTPLMILYKFSVPVEWGPFHFPATLAITQEGLRSALLFMTRLGTSVTLVAVLTLTTRWYELLSVLRSFLIPKIFVMTLEMTYRYIHVFILSMEELLLARKARDAGALRTKEHHLFIASALGSLFSKTLTLSEEVYFSMLARGYTGEPRTARSFRFSLWDLFIMAVIILTSLTLIAADQANLF